MKICVVMDRLPVYNGGYSQRIQRELKLLSGIEGIELYLYVLTSAKNYINNKVKDSLLSTFPYSSIKCIKTVFLASKRIPKTFNCLKYYDRFYAKHLTKFIRLNSLDYLLCENLECAYLGKLVFDNIGVPYVMDYHGVVPEETVFNGECSESDKLYEYLKDIELQALKNAAHVICVSNRFKDYLISNFNIISNRISVVPCCVDDCKSTFNPEYRKKLRIEKKLDERKILIYAGSITKYQCIKEMIYVFQILHEIDKSWFFEFLSAYPDYSIAEELFLEHNINKSDYSLSCVDHKDIDKYYSMADVGIIIRNDHILNKVASPTKIAEYLRAGLLLFATNNIGDIMDVPTRCFRISYSDLENASLLTELAHYSFSDNERIENSLKAEAFLRTSYVWESFSMLYRNIFGLQ